MKVFKGFNLINLMNFNKHAYMIKKGKVKTLSQALPKNIKQALHNYKTIQIMHALHNQWN